MDAHQLLRATESNYFECRSYEDSGRLECKSIADGQERSPELAEFRTIFIRPSLVRFEFVRTNSPNAVLLQADGDSIRVHLSHEKEIQIVQSFDSLDTAAAAIQGVTLLTFPVVLSFLSDIGRFGLSNLKRVERLEDDKVDGDTCYKVRGEWGYNDIDLWIGQGSNVVKQIVCNSIRSRNSMGIFETAKQLAKLEGKECDIPNSNSFYSITKITFKTITFNNSITIDAIG